MMNLLPFLSPSPPTPGKSGPLLRPEPPNHTGSKSREGIPHEPPDGVQCPNPHAPSRQPLSVRPGPFPPLGQVPWHHPPSPQAPALRGSALRDQASPGPSRRKFPQRPGLPTSPQSRGRPARTPTSCAVPLPPSPGKRPWTLRGHLRWPSSAAAPPSPSAPPAAPPPPLSAELGAAPAPRLAGPRA